MGRCGSSCNMAMDRAELASLRVGVGTGPQERHVKQLKLLDLRHPESLPTRLMARSAAAGALIDERYLQAGMCGSVSMRLYNALNSVVPDGQQRPPLDGVTDSRIHLVLLPWPSLNE